MSRDASKDARFPCPAKIYSIPRHVLINRYDAMSFS